MADSKTYAPHPGVKRIAASNPLLGEGRLREKRCNSTTGEILTNIDGTQWKGTQGTLVTGIAAFDHPDLIAAWTMDNISGATLVDETAAGLDLTMTNSPVSVSGKLGDALQFNSAGDKAERTTGLTPFVTSQGAVACWCAIDGATSPVRPFNATIAAAVNDYIGISVGTSGQVFFFYRTAATANEQLSSDTNAPTTGFFFLVVSSDGVTNRVWINAVETTLTKNTGTNDGVWFDNITPTAVTVGLMNRDSDLEGGGKVDQLRVFNRPLTQTEIDVLYNGGVGV